MKETDRYRSMKNHRLIFLVLFIALLLFFVLDLLLGSVLLPFRSVMEALFSPGSSAGSTTMILYDFRIPKAITALVVGVALSISGLQMQTVFRNPLAGPYVLGVSAGASLAVAFFALGTSAFIFGFSLAGTMSLALVAWLGAFLVMLLVLFVSARVNDNVTILILGMLFTSAAGAVVNILQYFSNESLLKAFIVWTMGSLGSITTTQLKVMIPAVAAGIMITLFKLKDLNAFLLGETYARSIGVNIRSGRMFIFFSASLLTGTVTAFCGPIGFIGIAVPHLTRVLFKVSDHQTLVPGVILIGANLMLISDIISQMPGLHTTLPINSVTALIGIPVIVWMIVKNRKFANL